ncbi:hypothetical protein BJ508DRAFT_217360 [Ascobolus immersus RN42]|uniref:Uncharacterized protein n=1 Tax=Ascobolus immersus RN42 TaxID=1160509 RepID=A0A3N4HCQ8_ASCIM|nr:hypothetical protein BJ508DRAFT_217360 [Ascobolus immersus RN42]
MFCSFTLGASLYDFKPDKSSLPTRGSTTDNKTPIPLRFPLCILHPSPDDPDVPLPTPPPIDPTFGLATYTPSPQSSLVPKPGAGRDHPFYRSFSKVRRLIDITPDHLIALNLHHTHSHALSDLLPEAYHIPPPSPALPAADSPEYLALSETQRALLDRRRSLQTIFAERAAELSIRNSDAFDTLARIRRDLKLGNMFRFFQTVELVTAYFKEDAVKQGEYTAGMPEKFREELVKTFLEPIGWWAEMRYNAPRNPSKIALLNSLFQSRHDLLSYLPPPSNDERRLGILEGPIYAVQVRHDENFTTPSYIRSLPPYGRWEQGDVWDLAREVGGIIAMAQERRKARIHAGEKIGRVRARVVGPVRKDEEEKEDGDFDEVWMIVCVHAHIAIVKGRVSERYLKFLETCDLEAVTGGDQSMLTAEGGEWAGLRVMRSRWWCLVDPEERVEAAYAVGGVMERMCGDVEIIFK